jgi:uncharacterized protein (TIGR00251 family)
MESPQARFSDALAKGSVTVTVKPNAKSSELLGHDPTLGTFRVAIKAPPRKGAANKELVRFVSKMVGKRVEIVSGFSSRTKVLRILG